MPVAATVTTDAIRVAEARRWYRQQGYRAVEDGGVTVVATPEHPDTWEANWAAAGPGVTADALLTALDCHLATASSHIAQVDALTDPAVEAALALADFRAENVLIEMIADVVRSPHPLPQITLQRVGAAEWHRFATLVDADMREGKRTGAHDEVVAAGLLDGMRRRLDVCDFWLLKESDATIGYGMTAACPNGLGLIENLFTSPEHRGRGLMSAFIVAAARRLRAAGCDAVFLDAHAHDRPKRLYAQLGFRPVALTRTWVRPSRA